MTTTEKRNGRNGSYYYQKRKAEGKCPMCGGDRDAETVFCTKCREKRRESKRADYYFYQQYGLCPKCKKNKLEGSEKTCPECCAAQAVYQRRAIEKGRIHKTSNTKLRQSRINSGMCEYCGKRKAIKGQQWCIECRVKAKKKRDAKRTTIIRTERVSYGLCYNCGEPLNNNGYHVCNKCLTARQERMNYAREGKDMNLSKFTKPTLDKWKLLLNLTDEENVIFDMLSKRKSRIEISVKIGLSEKTVGRRIKDIRKKMDDLGIDYKEKGEIDDGNK